MHRDGGREGKQVLAATSDRRAPRAAALQSSREGFLRHHGPTFVIVAISCYRRPAYPRFSRPRRPAMPTAFLTVGSTKFEALVRAADTEEVARALTNRGFDKLVLQVRRGRRAIRPSRISVIRATSPLTPRVPLRQRRQGTVRSL